MEHVIIGVDPHKMSATIEVVDQHVKRLGQGRFTTDQAGYAAMRAYAMKWPDRVWAVEGANGAGRPLAQRLLEAGEQVLDVPAKLAARVRLFDTGYNRKTDARDAYIIAETVRRHRGDLTDVGLEASVTELPLLVAHRSDQVAHRVRMGNRLCDVLSGYFPSLERAFD